MADGFLGMHIRHHVRMARMAAVLAGAALVAGCSSMSPFGGSDDVASLQAMPEPSHAQGPVSELAQATEYWGKEYVKNPNDGKAAVNYAKNLKAMGRKKEALAVLQQTHRQNTQNREHLSEYGRLALELGQVSTAKPLLERADDPANPDWRVISARGTVLAKEGQYKEAIALFERARTLAPDQASVLNNLAMAHAMDGEAAKAEVLLRQAAEAEGADARVRQNLALVLGVQGKYGEAKSVAGTDLPAEVAQANVDYLRKMTQAEQKPAARTAEQPAALAASRAGPARSDDGQTNRKTASNVATSSIAPNDPDRIIGAAMEAEAGKQPAAENTR